MPLRGRVVHHGLIFKLKTFAICLLGSNAKVAKFVAPCFLIDLSDLPMPGADPY